MCATAAAIWWTTLSRRDPLKAVQATALAPQVLVFKPTDVLPCGVRHGPHEWLVRFKPPPGSGQLRWICIHGASPCAVQWVQVRRHTHAAFELDSLQDRTGHLSTAGEMLQAMASLDGHLGMRIDCRGSHPLSVHEAGVALRLKGPDVSAVSRLVVHARVLSA